MDNEEQEEDQVSGRMHENDNEEEQQDDAEKSEEKDTGNGHESTRLTPEEKWTPMQITASVQNILDKVEEQEGVNEEGEPDREWKHHVWWEHGGIEQKKKSEKGNTKF